MRTRLETSSWSLVAFTVCAQAAAGVAVMRVVLPLVLPAPPAVLIPLVPVEATRASLSAMLAPLGGAALLLLAAGGAAAALHLARPRAARLALAHLRTSWLSREALLGGLFGGVLLLELVLRRAGVDAGPLRGALPWVAAGLGLLFVYAIVRVYRIRTVPAWDARATDVAFFGTTLLLGVAGAALLFVVRRAEGHTADQSLRSLGLIGAGIVVVELWTLRRHLRRLETEGGAAAQGARAVLRVRRGLLGLRTTCALVGASILVAGTAEAPDTATPAAVVVACGLLLLSEILGRYLFYASHRRVGL